MKLGSENKFPLSVAPSEEHLASGAALLGIKMKLREVKQKKSKGQGRKRVLAQMGFVPKNAVLAEAY